MGCCSSTDEAKGTTGRRGSNEFNDLHDDGPKAREGNKTGQASPTARGKKYAATSNAAAPGVDGDIDMDAQVASVLAAQPKPGKVPAAAAASPAHSPSPSSSDASSDDEGGAAAPPPPPPTMPVIMQRKDPNSLAQSEAELEEARRKREEAKKEAGVETKAMEIFFDDDDAVEPDVDPDAEQGAVEDFSAALSIPSPTKNLGLEGRDPDAVPGPWWFTDRGVLPPRSVVWYQNRDSIFIEITPANEDAGYGITDGNKLCYNCSIAPADSAAAPSAIESFSPTDIILYTTTVSGNTITKQHCRDMERILYLHKLHAHTMDVGEHGFMRKVIIQQCGGKDLGLPLLFVGERLIGTSEDVQLLVDREDFLKTLGDEVVAKARARFTGVPTNDEVYRVELSLLGKVQGPHWTVVPSNRPNVQPGEKMMTLRAMKLGDPKYWPQLIKGTMAEIKELSWLSRDMTREVDSDDDDDVA